MSELLFYRNQTIKIFIAPNKPLNKINYNLKGHVLNEIYNNFCVIK